VTSFATNARKARKLARLVRTPRYRRALRHGVAAAVEHAYLQLDHPPATVIDVGANRGQFALFARERFPLAEIVCFEPLDEARSVLERVFANDPAITVRSEALSDAAGSATFHQTRSDDSSSLLPVTGTQRRYFRGSVEVGTLEVQTAPLDELLDIRTVRRPCLLKIDVQGAELLVLRGGTGLLSAVDHVLVECSFVELYAGQSLIDDVVSFMRSVGFRLAGTGAPVRGDDGRPLQVDTLFSRRS
jgi:FkbM family methyltransferase